MARKNQARKSKEAALSATQLHELTRKTFLAETALARGNCRANALLEQVQTFINESDCASTRASLQEKYNALHATISEVVAKREQRMSSLK